MGRSRKWNLIFSLEIPPTGSLVCEKNKWSNVWKKWFLPWWLNLFTAFSRDKDEDLESVICIIMKNAIPLHINTIILHMVHFYSIATSIGQGWFSWFPLLFSKKHFNMLRWRELNKYLKKNPDRCQYSLNYRILTRTPMLFAIQRICQRVKFNPIYKYLLASQLYRDRLGEDFSIGMLPHSDLQR